MQVTGFITHKCAPQEGTSANGNAWKSQDFVIQYDNGEHPKDICLSLFGSKLDEFGGLLKPNAYLRATFDCTTREKDGRYFNSLRCWKLEPAQPVATAPAAPQAPAAPSAPVASAPSAAVQAAQAAMAAATDAGEQTDLPF